MRSRPSDSNTNSTSQAKLLITSLFLTTHKKIYIYNVFRNFELRIPIETEYNPKGILEVNGADDPCFFAYLSKGSK